MVFRLAKYLYLKASPLIHLIPVFNNHLINKIPFYLQIKLMVLSEILIIKKVWPQI